MCVNDQADSLAGGCSLEQEVLQRWIERRLPIRLRSNLPIYKLGNEIQHVCAAVLQPVGGMLERLDAINTRTRFGGIGHQALPCASLAERLAIEHQPPLRHPLVDNLVVNKG